MRTIQSKIGNPLTKNHKNQPAFLLIYGHKRPVFVLTGEIFLSQISVQKLTSKIGHIPLCLPSSKPRAKRTPVVWGSETSPRKLPLMSQSTNSLLC
jgi:hypothetical protein